jgi:hypothetical protein
MRGSTQLALPGLGKLVGPWQGIRWYIYTGTGLNPGIAPTVREIAEALVVDEARVRRCVDSLIENHMVVEQAGVLRVTDWEPHPSMWSKPSRWPPRVLEPLKPTAADKRLARSLREDRAGVECSASRPDCPHR